MKSFRSVERLAVGLDLEGQPRPVGTLAWSQRERRSYFEFAPEFLVRPLPLSPFRVETTADAQPGPHEPFDGLHGLFADSLPDGWGRKLLDRHMARLGYDHRLLTPLEQNLTGVNRGASPTRL